MYLLSHLHVSCLTSVCINLHICMYLPVFHGYIHTHTAIECFYCAKSAARRLTRISLGWNQPQQPLLQGRRKQQPLRLGRQQEQHHQHQIPHRHFPSGESPSDQFLNHHSAFAVDWLHGNVSKIRRTRLHSPRQPCENIRRMQYAELEIASQTFAGDRSRT